MPRKILVLVAAVSLLMTFRTRLVQIQWVQGAWAAASPRPSFPSDPSFESDLDSDGLVEQVVVQDGYVSVTKRAQTIWASPPEWKIAMAQITDLNRDRRPEVALLVWRPFAPWPVDAWLPHGGRIADFHDSKNRSCHIILWGWAGNKYRELWAGSALAEPIVLFHAADWNGDGFQELAAVESEYDHPAEGRALSLWEWNGFGFSLVNRRIKSIGRMAFLTDGDGRPSVLFEPSNWFFPFKEMTQ